MSTFLHLTDGRTLAVNITFDKALETLKGSKEDELLMFDPGNGEQKRYIFFRHIIEVSRGHSK
jgi:hypothetical protein